MKHQKTLNLLNGANDSKFGTRKWNIVNDLSHANYEVGNEIICNKNALTLIRLGFLKVVFPGKEGGGGAGGQFDPPSFIFQEELI